MKNERELAGMIMDADIPARLQAENEKLRRILNQLISNWHEFGPEGGYDEYIDGAERFLKSADGQPDTSMARGCCSAISPCSHQQRDPRSICDQCQEASHYRFPL